MIYILKYIQIENSYFNIPQYDSICCIKKKKNAALVREHFTPTPNFWIITDIKFVPLCLKMLIEL